jgi:hypothetical protein
MSGQFTKNERTVPLQKILRNCMPARFRGRPVALSDAALRGSDTTTTKWNGRPDATIRTPGDGVRSAQSEFTELLAGAGLDLQTVRSATKGIFDAIGRMEEGRRKQALNDAITSLASIIDMIEADEVKKIVAKGVVMELVALAGASGPETQQFIKRILGDSVYLRRTFLAAYEEGDIVVPSMKPASGRQEDSVQVFPVGMAGLDAGDVKAGDSVNDTWTEPVGEADLNDLKEDDEPGPNDTPLVEILPVEPAQAAAAQTPVPWQAESHSREIPKPLTEQDKTLFRAIEGKDVAAAAEALGAGADVNARDVTSMRTPIMQAVISQSRAMVELLHEWRTHVNDADCIGWTALMFASAIGNEELVVLLRSWGARDDMTNARGQTAMDIGRHFPLIMRAFSD